MSDLRLRDLYRVTFCRTLIDARERITTVAIAIRLYSLRVLTVATLTYAVIGTALMPDRASAIMGRYFLPALLVLAGLRVIGSVRRRWHARKGKRSRVLTIRIVRE